MSQPNFINNNNNKKKREKNIVRLSRWYPNVVLVYTDLHMLYKVKDIPAASQL